MIHGMDFLLPRAKFQPSPAYYLYLSILLTTCSFSLQKSTKQLCLVWLLFSRIYMTYHSQTLGWGFLSALPELNDISFFSKKHSRTKVGTVPSLRNQRRNRQGFRIPPRKTTTCVCQCEDHGAYGLLHWLLVHCQHAGVPEWSWLGTMGDRPATWEVIKSLDARMIDFNPGAWSSHDYKWLITMLIVSPPSRVSLVFQRACNQPLTVCRVILFQQCPPAKIGTLPEFQTFSGYPWRLDDSGPGWLFGRSIPPVATNRWCTYEDKICFGFAESPCFPRGFVLIGPDLWVSASVLIYQARFQHDATRHSRVALQRAFEKVKPFFEDVMWIGFTGHFSWKLRKSFVRTLSEIQEDDLRNGLGTCNHYDLQALQPVCSF